MINCLEHFIKAIKGGKVVSRDSEFFEYLRQKETNSTRKLNLLAVGC